MADFQSNITFGKSKADTVLEILEYQWRLSPPEHCCDCTPHLCPEFLKPRTCSACDDWLHE